MLENGTNDFGEFIDTHNVKTIPGTRSIIIVDIHQVGSSCGFSVPYYDFKDFRPILNNFFANKQKKFEEGKAEESIDRYFRALLLNVALGEQQLIIPADTGHTRMRLVWMGCPACSEQ